MHKLKEKHLTDHAGIKLVSILKVSGSTQASNNILYISETIVLPLPNL